jgi:hypothetical protein
MDEILHKSPGNWLSHGNEIAENVFEEMRREYHWTTFYILELRAATDLPRPSDLDLWCRELLYVRLLRWEYKWDAAILDLLGRILCQALEVPQDCRRDLSDQPNHILLFFTNHRAIQVYCCHNSYEVKPLLELVAKDFEFRFKRRHDKLDDQNYEQYTEGAFRRSRPYLVWECIFPEGFDMEALSPRDANAHIRLKQSAPKAKAPVVKLTQKEKDHPPPPPAEVREPPSSDRKNGAIYHTGRLLGRGGFAICYEGQLSGTKQIYALKIVKSHMPQKKMEQKVKLK